MIALLRGVVAQRDPGEVILDVAGVGYRVRVPGRARLAPAGEEQTLHTHLAVREDAMDLYGFADPTERDLFTVLLGVSGIGPKIALAAVDTLGAEGLRAAVVTEDITALTAIPGVGKKGAQRMALELQSTLGKLPAPSGAPTPPGASATTGEADPRAEARQALAALGYAADEVEHALRGVAVDAPATDQIRAALRGLAA